MQKGYFMNPNQMMLCDKSARNFLPREKIEKYGASALTNEELLALILGSGNQDCNVFELSRHLADFLSDQTQVPTLEKIRKIRGDHQVFVLVIRDQGFVGQEIFGHVLY